MSARDAYNSATEGDWTGTALAAAGAIPIAGYFLRPARSVVKSRTVGSRPPEMYQRPFTADYPNVTVNQGENLTVDIDGRPLGAEFVAGRRVAGEADQQIGAHELSALSKSLFYFEPVPLPAKDLAGAYGKLRLEGGGKNPTAIEYRENLTPRQKEIVLSHEIRHGIDALAGLIDTKGLMDELKPMFDTLLTGQTREGRKLTGPQHIGYSKTDVPRELMAEAIRAYIQNPNYIKWVAPKTAAAIRAAVNANPRLNKTIQFNVAAPLAAGAAATGLMYQEEEP